MSGSDSAVDPVPDGGGAEWSGGDIRECGGGADLYWVGWRFGGASSSIGSEGGVEARGLYGFQFAGREWGGVSRDCASGGASNSRRKDSRGGGGGKIGDGIVHGIKPFS